MLYLLSVCCFVWLENYGGWLFVNWVVYYGVFVGWLGVIGCFLWWERYLCGDSSRNYWCVDWLSE